MKDAYPWRWEALATYNAERGRGLMHRPEYVALMEREQAEFDAAQVAERLGTEILSGEDVKEIVGL